MLFCGVVVEVVEELAVGESAVEREESVDDGCSGGFVGHGGAGGEVVAYGEEVYEALVLDVDGQTGAQLGDAVGVEFYGDAGFDLFEVDPLVAEVVVVYGR